MSKGKIKKEKVQFIELLVCPFCGNPDRLEITQLMPNLRGPYIVHCYNCNASGPEGVSPKDAADRWDTRFNNVKKAKVPKND